MIKAVLFDLFNTLAYVSPDHYRNAKRQMAEKIKVAPDVFYELWRQYSRMNNRGEILMAEERVARVLRDLGIYAERALVYELANIEYELQEKGVQIAEYTHQVLSTLKQMDMKLGLVTNTGYSTSKVPALLGLPTLMDTIVLSYAVRVVKPGWAIYQIACDRLQVTPQDCLYVGDGDDDELEGAASLGMTTVWLREQREKILYAKSPKQYSYVIDSLDKLIPIIQSLGHV